MVGEEFIPLGVSQFASTIQNIQKAKPDILITLLVGTAQSSYYEQAAAANLHIPMGSSVNVGQAYEHKRFKPPSLANMYVTTNWIEEVDDQKSKDFVAKWHVMFPKEPYINQEAENSYLAVYLYKEMVERANGSTKRDDLRKIVAQGDVCFDAPEGHVCLDPKSQHMSHTIYLAKVNERPFDLVPQGVAGHQTVLAWRSRLRSDQEEPERPVHAEQSAAQELRVRSVGP